MVMKYTKKIFLLCFLLIFMLSGYLNSAEVLLDY